MHTKSDSNDLDNLPIRPASRASGLLPALPDLRQAGRLLVIAAIVVCFGLCPQLGQAHADVSTSILGDSLVPIEIRYHMPEAQEVTLKWGVDGWRPVPEELWPPETNLENGIMNTRMVREGNSFAVKVLVPRLAHIEYGFLITELRDGTPVDVWDREGHILALPRRGIHVQAGVTFVGGQPLAVIESDELVPFTIDYKAAQASEVYLVWGINGWTTIPREERPDRTEIAEGLMRTPMHRTSDWFSVEIQTPLGATVDYGFLTTNTRDGANVHIWDANGSAAQGYHSKVTSEGGAEIWAPPSVISQMVKADMAQARTRSGIVLAAIACLMFGVVFTGIWTAFHPRRPQAKNVIEDTKRRPRRRSYTLLRELVVRDTKLRYRRSILGIFWSLLNPLAYMVVFTFLSRRVLAFDIPHYPAFVFIGTLAWSWLQNSVTLAAGAVTGNRDLIVRPGFPATILPVAIVTSNLVHFLLALLVPLTYFLIRGGRPTFATMMLPLVVVPQFLITLGLGYLVATFQVTFRDTQHLLAVLFRLLYFLTPIFYDARAVPKGYEALYRLNPMFHLITAYRDILLYGRAPDVIVLPVLGLIGVILLWSGHVVFRRASPRFAEEV